MAKKNPLTDFRAVRGMLEPHEFALSEGQDVPASDLIDEDVWNGIIHLPEDVSIRISDHNGIRLGLLYSLWGDWLTATGDPDKPDEIFSCMVDASVCFQCSIFSFLHGFYRSALAELRTALELVMIGTYGSLNPKDKDYLSWKAGTGEIGFTGCRRRLYKGLPSDEAQWLFADGALLAGVYQALCNYTHSRASASDGALWKSNGPVYNNDAIKLTVFTSLSVYAICYLLVRLARADFVMPEDSDILFELDWMTDSATLVRAFTDVYGKPTRPPLKD